MPYMVEKQVIDYTISKEKTSVTVFANNLRQASFTATSAAALAIADADKKIAEEILKVI